MAVDVSVLVQILAQTYVLRLVETDVDVARSEVSREGSKHFVYQLVCFRFVHKQNVVYVDNVGVHGQLDQIVQVGQRLYARHQLHAVCLRICVHILDFVVSVSAAHVTEEGFAVDLVQVVDTQLQQIVADFLQYIDKLFYH